MTNFNEHALEMSIMELFKEKGYTYVPVKQIHQERRIYDWALGICIPVRFNDENFRKAGAVENRKKAVALLGRV